MSNTGVKLRPLDSTNTSEVGFVFKSWIGSYRNHCEVPYNMYRKYQQAMIERITNREPCNVVLAVHPEYPEQIFGFIVYEDNHNVVHYVYTKEDYRRKGVASDMLEYAMQSNTTGSFEYTYSTSLGRKYLNKRGGKYRVKFVRNELPGA